MKEVYLVYECNAWMSDEVLMGVYSTMKKAKDSIVRNFPVRNKRRWLHLENIYDKDIIDRMSERKVQREFAETIREILQDSCQLSVSNDRDTAYNIEVIETNTSLDCGWK